MTLGPTREYFDSVRFLSNASSGKMGLAIAEEFRSCGAKLFLICGPGVSPSDDFSFCTVISARQMLKEVEKRFKNCDIFASVAAVADYRPVKVSRHKIHKNRSVLNVQLVGNPDILAVVGRKKKKQFCLGFSLEDKDGIGNARKKLEAKRCDLMVLNSPDSMESDQTNATLVYPDDNVRPLGRMTKIECARKICQAVSQAILKKNSKST